MLVFLALVDLQVIYWERELRQVGNQCRHLGVAFDWGWGGGEAVKLKGKEGGGVTGWERGE